MKLIDEILRATGVNSTAEIGPESYAQFAKDVEAYRLALCDSEVVEISNVAKYCWDNKTGDVSDPPSIAPPFKRFWMEYEYNGARVGGLIESERTENGGWKMWIRLTIGRDDALVISGFCYVIHVSSNGKYERRQAAAIPGSDMSAVEHIFNLYWAGLTPFFMALGFMHCKNVIVEEVQVSPRLAKKQAKRYGFPAVKYKQIKIQPMRRIVDRGGLTGTGRRDFGLHIVRGHHKDFRGGNGLFGKYKDIFWWEDSLRGDMTKGIVHKEYNVEGPK